MGLPRNKENAASISLSLCKRDGENLACLSRLHAAIPLLEIAKKGTERVKRKATSLLEHLQKLQLQHVWQVKQLHDWLSDWNKKFLNTGQNGNGKKQNDSGAKKVVLLSGNPGIGKTTSAKLVSHTLGFWTIEVKLSDLPVVSISFRSSVHPVPL